MLTFSRAGIILSVWIIFPSPLFVEYPIIETFCARPCNEDIERQYNKQKRVLVLIPEFTVADKKSNIGHCSNN